MNLTNKDNKVFSSKKKYKIVREWLQKHMREAISGQKLQDTEENTSAQRKTAPERSCTKSTSVNVYRIDVVFLTPKTPVDSGRVSSRPPILPPIHPTRPDSSVFRNVNAWLEASVNAPSPPLMAGISYWKEATIPNAKGSAVVQYAVPLSVALGVARPTTATRQRTPCFRRSARKVQVQMPSILRKKSVHLPGKKRRRRQSVCITPLSISYPNVQEDTTPMLITRSKSFLKPLIPPTRQQKSARHGLLISVSDSRECVPPRHGTLNSARFGDVENDTERHAHRTFMRTGRDTDITRPSTALAGLVCEDSVGDLSDAPTYSSGPPPPSYRSRRESMLTTSSFGCIDGMNPAQRQVSQQRAALQKGMGCKLKRLVQNFGI
ncbi:hypothetical protein COCC4DRAFT_23347 [Bipolaris maydis ATCC 48331]|uniref:Uncharacterized protein n=2 Tax=Cochliobolus heterostrophus TaxID=5016 RepID=M2UL12_COCH5|nr:uncharacterized protein COCC4DRAFT_23347 [Bipolaris maydis ATCC 48331]EMD88678.1 hypothetical protein COCHEDRAFT_1032846 [Bipolaris maydis C5]KAH7556665.1 hypothetical protein BM1_06099 [Bipolaris maydis]ENI05605.1 hypothetical protein COCC4DRAFT_23347 [Bipolaris maydis ATCC 48331]KAJ5028728.1 hypothetical protein J3E73DRAFT_367660 [Bipolaris maydis]KAJ5063517.1 hypothetical protein J3E74DRAFT_287808 [Bipolaris maydis]